MQNHVEGGGREIQPHEHMRKVESHARKIARLVEERESSEGDTGAFTAENALQFSEIIGDLNTLFQEGDYDSFNQKSIELYNLISPYGKELLCNDESVGESLYEEFRALSEALSQMSEGTSTLEGFDQNNFSNMTGYFNEIVGFTGEKFGFSKKEEVDAVGSVQGDEDKTEHIEQESEDSTQSQNSQNASQIGWTSEDSAEMEALIALMNDSELAQNETDPKTEVTPAETKPEEAASLEEKRDEIARHEALVGLARSFGTVAETALLFQRRTLMREREGMAIQLLEPRSAIRITASIDEAVLALKNDDIRSATEYLSQIPGALRNFGEGRSAGSSVKEDVNSLSLSMNAFNELAQSLSIVSRVYMKNENLIQDQEFSEVLGRIQRSLRLASENGDNVLRRVRAATNRYNSR